MNSVDILSKIIEEDGNCSWSKPSICSLCPISKLKKHPDGRWMSCIEAIGINNNHSEEDADFLYKEAAIKLLIEHEIEGMLGDNSDGPK
jgi:hypothetical protein